MRNASYTFGSPFFITIILNFELDVEVLIMEVRSRVTLSKIKTTGLWFCIIQLHPIMVLEWNSGNIDEK